MSPVKARTNGKPELEVVTFAAPCPTPETLSTMTYGDYTISLVMMDPQTAQCWLDRHNTHNRNPRKSRKLSYARDMEAGLWMFNGDTICRTQQGVLIDGQHRLESIVDSGTTQMVLLVEGLPIEAQDSKDGGAMRTFADQLGLADMPYATLVGAIARRVAYFQQGIGSLGGLYQPTRPEMRLLIDSDRARFARAGAVASHAFLNKAPCAPSVIGAAWYLCAKKSKTDAEAFFVTKFVDSVGLERYEPAHALQQRLKKTSDGKPMDPNTAFRFLLLGWNYYREGVERIERLQAPRGGWPPIRDWVIK